MIKLKLIAGYWRVMVDGKTVSSFYRRQNAITAMLQLKKQHAAKT